MKSPPSPRFPHPVPAATATATALAIIAIALVTVGARAATEASRKPNIIYVLLDDAGYGDLGCYGQTKFKTPNIDRLAAQGMRFTQHYSGSTVCAPTRSVLMTGLHTGHTPVRGNREHKPVGQEPIPDETVTVAELLKKAGYATSAFGKWGLGYPGSEGDPVNQGFDTFFGYNCQRNAHNYFPKWLYHNKKKIELDGKTYSHDLIMDEALKWIRARRDGPFFCYLPVTIPHAAMHVPEKYAAPFRKKFPQFEDVIGKYSGPEVKNPVAAFAGMMTHLDDDIGRLMALLKQLGIDDNTIVLFSSDNGPHREGGHRPAFFNSSGGLRGIKRDLFEGGVRAPFIARWPGRIPAGSTSALVSAQWDILPTLCALAGSPAPAGIDGISLAPTLLGHPENQQQHDYLYWEFYEGGGKRAARFGDHHQWKAVQLKLNKSPDPPVLIFNLESDPAEKSNIANQHPDLVARAREIFTDAHTPSDHWRWRNPTQAPALP